MNPREQQLIDFAKSGNLTALINLMQNGVDIHANSDEALIASAENGHTNIVRFLVENGADVHTDDDFALSASAANGHAEIVRFLVKNGASVHGRHDLALQSSALHEHTNIVRFLLQNGANVHADGDRALGVSARRGYTSIVKILVQNGAYVHTNNDYPIRSSASNGHTEVVKFLVQNKADVHADDDYALRLSAQNGYTEIVKFLVQNRANVHAYDNYALRLSASNGHTQIVKFLVQNGSDVHGEDDYALRLSAENGHTEIVKFLVQNGADVRADNDFAFRISSEKGHTEIVEFFKLLRKNAVKEAFRKIPSMIQNNKDTRYYKWQKLCALLGNRSLEEIKSLARLQNIESNGLSKRKICNALAIKYERKMTRQLTCANATTILGDDPSLIPKPLLYTVKEGKFNYCFNIIELIKIINLGGTKNPFTNASLDVADIKRKYEKLQQILVEDKLALVNILDEIKNNRIMDADSILTLQIVNLVALMQHPPSVQDITEMSEVKIRAMISFINDNPLMRIGSSTRIKDFIQECLRILLTDDSHQATRKAALEIYFTQVFST